MSGQKAQAHDMAGREASEPRGAAPESGAIDAASLYNAVAAQYTEAFQEAGARPAELAALKKAVGRFSKPPRVLEIGCGPGQFLRAVAERIESGTGLDAAAAMVSQAGTRARLQGGKAASLSFVEGKAEALPFADGSFDLVYFMLSFRYMERERALAEARRVLAPGGLILVVDMASWKEDSPRTLRETAWTLAQALRAPLDIAKRMVRRAIGAGLGRRGGGRALKSMIASYGWKRIPETYPAPTIGYYRDFFNKIPSARATKILDRSLRALVFAVYLRPDQARPGKASS